MQPDNAQCQHFNTVITTTGSIRFSAGEIIDDTREELVCLDCGQVVEEVQIPIEVDWEDVIRFEAAHA